MLALCFVAIVRRVTGFSAVRSYPEATHIAATFEWGPPPQSIGVKSTAIYYRLSISPAPLNYPDTVEITDLSWNVSLEYNTNYTASITAVNCLSENSNVSIISAFFNIKDYGEIAMYVSIEAIVPILIAIQFSVILLTLQCLAVWSQPPRLKLGALCCISVIQGSYQIVYIMLHVPY